MEARPKIEKVSPNDKNYLKELSEYQEFTHPEVFGRGVVYATEVPVLRERLPKELIKSREYLETHLTMHSSKGIGLRQIWNLLEEGREGDPDNEHIYTKIGAKIRTDNMEGRREPVFTSGDLISDEVLIRLLTTHVKNVEQKIAKLEQILPEMKESFRRFIKDFLRTNGVDIDEATIDERIDSTPVNFVDPLITRLQERGGSFEDYRGVEIDVSLADREGSLDPELYDVFTHEMLHALSGRTLSKVKSHGRTTYESQRVGLRIYSRFRWLNETMTEYLTQKIRPNASDVMIGGYFFELPAFEALRTSGRQEIPELLFYNAYFENYDPSLPSGERIPHWKKLWHAINEAYEPGFLSKLDRAMRYKGVAFALGDYLRNKYRGEALSYIPKEVKARLDKVFEGEKK